MRVRHQCGVDEVESTRARYRLGEGITHVEIEAYIDDMAGAYRWADIVIARAGAITIAEIAACGIASILIPYPYAVDDHQTINARYLSDKGAAVLLPEHEMTTESLCTLLVRVLNDRNALIDMAMRARARGVHRCMKKTNYSCIESKEFTLSVSVVPG
jgi:UDP-N-acetylglucosamine--N-acetylmuramyl-(pentapeptide) pyrophosphoryl-undecaprenol N-acetylglucosamine transferase